MELKAYKKENDYSYSLGAFPTLELIKNKKVEVISIIYHSTFENDNFKKQIKSCVSEDRIFTSDKLINKLSDKENCFVIGVFKKYTTELEKDANHLLLDNPSNMGNLGTIIRSSLGFGIKNIAIIEPGVDYFNPKVVRASMGSIFSVNIEMFKSLEDYKEKYKKHTIYAFMLQAKQSLREADFKKQPLTLAFGNEATGLDNKYLDENSVIIKHSDKIDSLNITNAVSIGLYEYNSKTGNLS